MENSRERSLQSWECRTLFLPRYDAIVLSDVLEHAVAPDRLLRLLAPKLADGGRVCVSVPNARFWSEFARPRAKERFNVASTLVFRARAFRKKHPRFETVPRDDRSSKNQPKRVENGRDRSL